MQKAVEADLLQYFEEQGIGIGFSDTALENRAQARSQFNINTTILLVMTVLMAIVGSIGLIGEIITLLQSPITNVVSALQAQGGNLVGAIKTISEREEAA